MRPYGTDSRSGLPQHLRAAHTKCKKESLRTRTAETSWVAALVAAKAAVARPEGGMSIWCRAPQGLDAEGLLRDYGVAAMPGEVFGSSGAGWLRLALSMPLKDLDEAATRLRDAFAAA